MEHLDAAIEGIDYVDAVVVVDFESGGQLKLSESGAALAEVIQEPALAVEGLHHAPQAVDDVEMAFRIEADSFGAEHSSSAVGELADGVVKCSRAVENLNTKVHGVDHEKFRAAQAQLRRVIEFGVSGSGLADGGEHAALHIHDVDFVAQRVGDVNALGGGVDRDSGGALEESFAAFQAADHAAEFSAGIEDENLAGLRIGYVNIVLCINGNTLRREHGIFAAVFAGKKFVFFFGEVKDVDAVGAGVGDDDASLGIGGDAVGSDQEMEFGFAGDDIDHAGPEAALGLDLSLHAEGALEAELAAAIEQEIGRSGLGGGFGGFGGGGGEG